MTARHATQTKTRILSAASLFLFLATPLAGLWAAHLPPLLHPILGIVAAPILILIQVLLIKNENALPSLDANKVREQTSRRYLLIFGLVLGLCSGLGVQVGFLSYGLHQFIVWPLALFGLWENAKVFFTRQLPLHTAKKS